MDVIWDGVMSADALSEEDAAIRGELADSAKSYDWPRTLEILAQNPHLVNSSRPGGSSWYTPLHQAAHAPAPAAVIKKIVSLGAWRTLRNARGERPADVAARRGHASAATLLEPDYKRRIPPETLRRMQEHFHDVIRGRAERLVNKAALRRPELDPLLELRVPRMWFPVLGMYGGFSYRLVGRGLTARLVVESWSRVVGGSRQRHEVTPAGVTLTEEGFV